MAALKAEGCHVLDEINDGGEYGKFAWVMDPEGNKVELWQPPASVSEPGASTLPASRQCFPSFPDTTWEGGGMSRRLRR